MINEPFVQFDRTTKEILFQTVHIHEMIKVKCLTSYFRYAISRAKSFSLWWKWNYHEGEEQTAGGQDVPDVVIVVHAKNDAILINHPRFSSSFLFNERDLNSDVKRRVALKKGNNLLLSTSWIC